MAPFLVIRCIQILTFIERVFTSIDSSLLMLNQLVYLCGWTPLDTQTLVVGIISCHIAVSILQTTRSYKPYLSDGISTPDSSKPLIQHKISRLLQEVGLGPRRWALVLLSSESLSSFTGCQMLITQ